MTYSKQSWSDLPTTTTPISAARLGHIEDGIFAADGAAAAAQASADLSVKIGGDLSGTAAAPVVAKINGVAVTGTPTAGQVPRATSATAATWQDLPSGGSGGMTDPLTTPGDLIVRGATTTTRKGVGSNLQLLQVQTGNADKLGWVTADKTLVGLNLVDNTADADKPVSTLQAAANLSVLNQARVFALAMSMIA